MFDLKDRVIVLTGSTGVLASALAISLAKAKVKLFILGRNKNLLLELKKSTERYTVVEYYVADVLERSELETVCAKNPSTTSDRENNYLRHFYSL